MRTKSSPALSTRRCRIRLKNTPEGDALQWLWFVPHDIEGLVDQFPSADTFVRKLHQFFLDARPIRQGGKWAGGNALANAWYWSGNEPDILAPWMFRWRSRYHNYTSFWTRWLVDNDYGVGADGLPEMMIMERAHGCFGASRVCIRCQGVTNLF